MYSSVYLQACMTIYLWSLGTHAHPTHMCVYTWMNQLSGGRNLGRKPLSLPLALQRKNKLKVGASYW